MINRTMVRTRVIQTLFAYYKDGDKTPTTAQKELLSSFSDTYSLYIEMLEFVNELTACAEQQIEQAEARAKATHEQYTANRRFVHNRFAQQIFDNQTVRRYVDEQHLSWDAGMSAVFAAYRALLDAPYYQEYMAKDNCTYEDDSHLWKKIFTSLLPELPAMEEALEEMEVTLDHINWANDYQFVLSYMKKTIQLFHEDSTADVALLPMFDREDELQFGRDLLRYSIEGYDEYEAMINSHLKNWDAERIAYMDRIILRTALAEIFNFPDIALEVSMNEYIELAKEYSSEKSFVFVNGVLNEILREKKRDNSLLKALTLKEK